VLSQFEASGKPQIAKPSSSPGQREGWRALRDAAAHRPYTWMPSVTPSGMTLKFSPLRVDIVLWSKALDRYHSTITKDGVHAQHSTS
jgi:hypothetical protein